MGKVIPQNEAFENAVAELGDTGGMGDTNRRIKAPSKNLVVGVPNSAGVTEYRSAPA